MVAPGVAVEMETVILPLKDWLGGVITGAATVLGAAGEVGEVGELGEAGEVGGVPDSHPGVTKPEGRVTLQSHCGYSGSGVLVSETGW